VTVLGGSLLVGTPTPGSVTAEVAFEALRFFTVFKRAVIMLARGAGTTNRVPGAYLADLESHEPCRAECERLPAAAAVVVAVNVTAVVVALAPGVVASR
jgi:hypothetical protein